MSVKRFHSEKDNTLTNAFKPDQTTRATLSNMGASDVSEVFSIYGVQSTSSIENSRAIFEFSTTEINQSIEKGEIPSSGSVIYKLKVFNAKHSDTLPNKFYICAAPVLESWTEGEGLDLESYQDSYESNWIYRDRLKTWNTQGGTFPLRKNISNSIQSNIIEPSQYFDTGTEDVDIDITPIVQEWLKSEAGESTRANSKWFTTEYLPNNKGDFYTLYSTEGDYRNLIVSTSSAVHGKNIYFSQSSSDVTSTDNIVEAFALDKNPLFIVDHSPSYTYLLLTQSVSGIFGNTKVELVNNGASIGNPPDFSGGAGLDNNGIMLKLSSSYEDGSRERSYYTKKFFTRTSEFFFKRPIVECQFDSSTQATGSLPNPYKEEDEYLINITNLKSVYKNYETAKLKVHTRKKHIHPNIYTVARDTTKVDLIDDMYYKVSRLADQLDIIDYSDEITPSYSRLSYDISGSFFDLDMSLFEPNYSYQINFLRKVGNARIEQAERFKFRVEK